MKSRLCVAAVGVVLTAACAGGGDDEGAAESKPSRDARCLNVPRSVTQAIETGLTITGGGTLRFVQAVRSRDYSRIYFVSADLHGSGIEGMGDVGTWATNRFRPIGVIMAVDEVAQEFSDWPDGDSTDANVTMDADGASLSQDCVASVAK